MIGPAASYNSRDGGTTWELTEWVTSYGSPGSEVYISHPSGQKF
jgi:hypothetical protein